MGAGRGRESVAENSRIWGSLVAAGSWTEWRCPSTFVLCGGAVEEPYNRIFLPSSSINFFIVSSFISGSS